MDKNFKKLIQNLSLGSHEVVVDVIDPVTNITLYKKEGKDFMLKYADSIENWFSSLASKHKVNKIQVVTFEVSGNFYRKMPVNIDIAYAKSESLQRVIRETRGKLNRDLEKSKILNGFVMQQLKMYLNGKCSYEELKRVQKIVNEEHNKI